MAAKYNDKQLKRLLKESSPGYYSIGNSLYIRVSKEGTGFWVFRYSIQKKRREISFGTYPEISLAKAQLEAAQFKLEVKSGVDPQAEKKRLEPSIIQTVNDLADDWIIDLKKRLKYPNIPQRIYNKEIAPHIGELNIDVVNPRDIRGIIEKVANSDRPTIANDTLMYCKQLFRHAIKLDLRNHNPAEAFQIADAGGAEETRTRTLSLDELKTVFEVFRQNADQFTRDNYLAFCLLLTLGVRKGELVAAQWSELDLEKGIWDMPKERSKTGAPISIPLTDTAVDWLKELKVRAFDSEFVFPNRRASKRFGHISPDTINAAVQKLFRQEKLTMPRFTIHDLRRTFRSLLAELNVPGHVAERCLNHKLKGVEGIYDRYDYFEERKDAMERLTGHISIYCI